MSRVRLIAVWWVCTAGPSSAIVAFAGGTFIVSSGAVICLLIISVVVSEKSRKLLGFLRK